MYMSSTNRRGWVGKSICYGAKTKKDEKEKMRWIGEVLLYPILCAPATNI